VAAEVRTLAQRSAAAAKEIKQLITDSVGKVDAGGKLVDAAGRSMDDIVASVKRVAAIMGEITAASAEQRGGIEAVNMAITQMDEMTQRNAALVEEASAAAQSMRDQAKNLARTVSAFELGQDQTAASASHAKSWGNGQREIVVPLAGPQSGQPSLA
jgi:methyl-accepting chemotaxis protein